jgi:hypothetical protein
MQLEKVPPSGGCCFCEVSVKNHQQKSHTASTHQTVTEAIKFKTGQKNITISTTEQKLSAHAGHHRAAAGACRLIRPKRWSCRADRFAGSSG